jgi:large subunit ribosomal protein L25
MSELSEFTLKVSPREKSGRNACKSLRNSGKIPVILYGKAINKPYSVDDKETRMLLRNASGSTSLLRLLGENGEDELVLIKDLQKDQIKDKILHIDFIQVTRGEDLQTKVPLVITGEAEGVKSQGGILEVLSSEIEIKCRPSNLPSQVTLDISSLELGSNLQIKDLPQIDDVEYVDSPEMILASCVGSASGRSGAEDTEEEASMEGEETSEAEDSKEKE